MTDEEIRQAVKGHHMLKATVKKWIDEILANHDVPPDALQANFADRVEASITYALAIPESPAPKQWTKANVESYFNRIFEFIQELHEDKIESLVNGRYARQDEIRVGQELWMDARATIAITAIFLTLLYRAAEDRPVSDGLNLDANADGWAIELADQTLLD